MAERSTPRLAVRPPRRYGVTARGEWLRAGASLTHVRGLPGRAGLLGLSDSCGRPRCSPRVRVWGLDVHARSVAAAAIDGVYLAHNGGEDSSWRCPTPPPRRPQDPRPDAGRHAAGEDVLRRRHAVARQRDFRPADR